MRHGQPRWRRDSGTQYRTLNNADINGFTYQGVSRFFTMDARATWKVNETLTAAVGIDNLNNYWGTGTSTRTRSARTSRRCGRASR